MDISYASGTHSDITPASGKQARGFAEGIANYNAAGTNSATLVNGTVTQFCKEVDAAETAAPFLPELRGCFGHSWELWPVSLANVVAAARQGERDFLAAESLVALACLRDPALAATTRSARQKAEWFWAMLGDHAWNGTDIANKRHNAALRRGWAEHLARTSDQLTADSWRTLGFRTGADYLTVFNPLSFTNDIPVTVVVAAPVTGVRGVAASLRTEHGKRQLRFVAPRVPPFGFREFRFEARRSPATVVPPFSAGSNTLEGPFYRIRVDARSGGLASLVHKPSGQELVVGGSSRTLCQSVYFDGQECTMTGVQCQARFDACTGELRVAGRVGAITVTNTITLHAALDRVDFEVRIEKPPTTNEQRLLHFFPVGNGKEDLRIETTAAVLRPAPQPEGDLLPGADTHRFAVQGFVDYSPSGRLGVTVAPLDAYMLRLDQGALAFEALGNDQNWKEVTQDQDGERHFRFRYALRAHPPGYDNAAALAWSRGVAAPLVVASGRLPAALLNKPHLAVDPVQALVTCFKPADDAIPGKTLARVWKTSGASGPVTLQAPGVRRARVADLLEREGRVLPVRQGRTSVAVRPLGLGAVVLER
jgi:hypothetical protein